MHERPFDRAYIKLGTGAASSCLCPVSNMLILGLFVAFFLGGVRALVDEHVAKVLIVPELTPLTPVIFKAPASYLDTNSNPLAELLKVRSIEARQSYCPSGYGECTAHPGKCCPIGGACCSSNSTHILQVATPKWTYEAFRRVLRPWLFLLRYVRVLSVLCLYLSMIRCVRYWMLLPKRLRLWKQLLLSCGFQMLWWWVIHVDPFYTFKSELFFRRRLLWPRQLLCYRQFNWKKRSVALLLK